MSLIIGILITDAFWFTVWHITKPEVKAKPKP
jgi:hypothetical protein